MTLKELRRGKGLTQAQAATYLGIPLRTYVDYEKKVEKQSSVKYKYMIEGLRNYGYVDENSGIVSLEEIQKSCSKIFERYQVEYAYLFGSYAKGNATETSDVDLLVATKITGLQFFQMVEELREQLKKKVDVLDQRQIKENFSLVEEILKDGIKIYG